MSQAGETFFTAVGCMDGRVQKAIAKYGQEKFGVLFPDTITEAGLVGQLAIETPDPKLLESIKFKVVDVSIGKHHSKGIVVHGHQECAGNPVDDEKHKEDVKKSVDVIRSLVGSSVPIQGVFVVHTKHGWQVQELP